MYVKMLWKSRNIQYFAAFLCREQHKHKRWHLRSVGSCFHCHFWLALRSTGGGAQNLLMDFADKRGRQLQRDRAIFWKLALAVENPRKDLFCRRKHSHHVCETIPKTIKATLLNPGRYEEDNCVIDNWHGAAQTLPLSLLPLPSLVACCLVQLLCRTSYQLATFLVPKYNVLKLDVICKAF